MAISGRVCWPGGWNACQWDNGRHGAVLTSRIRPVDLRDRDYVLAGCPLVAQDDQVVLVDVTVRLAVREATDDEDLVLGYNPAEETRHARGLRRGATADG